jgi:NitT/TauT family transport system substrate-binding protein
VFAAASPVLAEEPVRIGLGFGLAFLPAYICEDLKLVEKHGKESHLDLRVSYQRFLGAAPLQEALATGAIDLAPFGAAPLLTAWEKAKDTPRQIFAVSGLTTLPPVLLTNRSDIRSLADFRSADRISCSLALGAAALFAADAVGKGIWPIRQTARPDRGTFARRGSERSYRRQGFGDGLFLVRSVFRNRARRRLSGSDVIDGKASFLILGASKGYIASHPKVPEAVAKAIDEAARIIHDDQHRAAEIYSMHEPSRTLDAAAVAGVLSGLRDEFGSAVRGIGAFADFMGRHGELKSPPASWKEIVAPVPLTSPSS